ncbi:MAG: hypothetical protein AAB577_00950 [Patescibacteria group bacterium]
MDNNLVVSVSLTLQRKLAVVHALYEFIDQKNNELASLAKRLQCTINERITGLELSKREIDDIINALELALKKIKDSGAQRYGTLSIAELERLADDFREFFRKF